MTNSQTFICIKTLSTKYTKGESYQGLILKNAFYTNQITYNIFGNESNDKKPYCAFSETELKESFLTLREYNLNILLND